MSVGVLLVVLLGALLHASWNLLVKSASDKRLSTALVYIGSGFLSALALPFLPLPAAAAWPYLGVSIIVEVCYGMLLAAAYGSGELSHAYPLMRGTAPLLVAIGSVVLVGESLAGAVWIGIAIMSSAIVSLLFDAHARRQSAAATGFALLNAVVIATYTVIDGVGSRKSGAPVAYSLWLFLFVAVPWLAWVSIRRMHRGRPRAELARGLIGGACSLASYTLALWAMTRAPIAAVAAVRETSIVFGTVLGALLLRERVSRLRAVAVTAIVAGVWIIRS